MLLLACTGPGPTDGSTNDATRDVQFDAPSRDVPLCTTNADCVGDPGGAACDTTSGRCVECIAANDVCPPAQHCDDSLHRCVSGCRSDLGCMTRDGGVLPDGGVFAIGRCDTSAHTCVECLGSGDCPAGMICAGRMCAVGCSATEPCASGSDCCGGGCVDVTSNVANCGACGQACAPPHATGACSSAQCTIGACDAGFGDCDGDPANGCETDLSNTIDHCGSCGMVCSSGANATAACVTGACTTTCASGFGDCDANAANGCETVLATDVVHCGGCGTMCTAPANATATCAAAACGFTCNAGFDDCDANATNGCEVALAIAPAHCGACGNACPAASNAAATCAGGACGIQCNAGFGDCDAMATNGCETSLSNNATNCGACGTTCSAPSNAAALCIAGSCAFACLAGFADCDTMGSNGCETDTRTSVTACGSCGFACPSAANATASCLNGTCGVSCTTGFGNCDANPSNGCETDLTANAAHCGACGMVCGAGTVCVSGSCRASWAMRFGGAGTEFGAAVGADASGNIYVAGYFDGTSSFGGSALVSAGSVDVFVASYTADGTHRWSRRLGGANTDVALRLVVDSASNVYVTGSFVGTADFGSGPLTSSGSLDIVVASLDSAGTTRWARRYGGTSSDQGTALVADIAGGIVLAAQFAGSVDFGTGVLVSAGSNDIALVSIGSNGLTRWAQRYGATGNESAFGIGEDGSGDVFVAGSFAGSTDLGSGVAPAVGGTDAFVARYESATGSPVWSRRFGSTGVDNAYDIAVGASDGSVYVTGTFGGTIDFGTGPISVVAAPDAYVLALNSAGTTNWIRRIGGSASEQAYRATVTATGDVAVAGTFSGTTDFGSGMVTGGGSPSGFVATYQPSGSLRWARVFGTSGTLSFNGIANESHGGLLLVGVFSGSQTILGSTLASAGGDDLLLVTLYP